MAGKSSKAPEKRTAKTINGAKRRPRGRTALLLALLISLGLLLAGLLTPALHVSSFGFVNDEVTILGSVQVFRDDGQIFLAGLIFIVSAIFPLLKIALALMLTLRFNPQSKWSHGLADALAELTRWSMTDVFILAIVVMLIDARLISSADLMPGAYYFAGGVLLSSLAVHYLRGSLKRHAHRALNDA